MPTYCYRCEVCGGRFTYPERGWWVCPTGDMAPLVRDYRSENVGPLTAGLKRMRERGLDGISAQKALRDIMLPTADEMRTPSDPTGQKGIRAWAERQVPKEGNKKPLYPDMEKQVF